MVNRKSLGFTLIELSIVIVVIGLIVGGIVIGKSLVRSARLRGALDECQRYKQAVGNFSDKYKALPGDFSGATALWSGTANGDGNGRITTQGSTGTYYEQFAAWQHLANAGMIEGYYTGVSTSGTETRVPLTNIPGSQINGAGWGLTTILVGDSSPDLPYVAGDLAPNTVLWLGGTSITGATNTQAPVLTSTEALQLDTKVDDGIPTTGKVVAQINPSGTACYNVSSQYDLTQTGLNCALVFKTGF
jgi:prepilin-type N-terminal cleavage/methylation domain-containing protein